MTQATCIDCGSHCHKSAVRCRRCEAARRLVELELHPNRRYRGGTRMLAPKLDEWLDYDPLHCGDTAEDYWTQIQREVRR